MTSVRELYDTADAMGVGVCTFPRFKAQTMSLEIDGRCCVALDSSVRWSENEEREQLSHELGHCATGAFYTRFSTTETRRKCEETATRWQIRKVLPFDELLLAMRQGDRTAYDLAERFGVSEDLVRRAVAYYRDACGIVFGAEAE